jgi:hypothetical protein
MSLCVFRATTINSLSYTKSFGNHNFNALAIQEAYKFELDQLGSQGEGFFTRVYVLSGSTTPSNVSGSITERISSYLGRLSYIRCIFLKDHLEEMVQRVSIKMSDGVVFFRGFLLISEEKFLQNSTTISNLKLKASYGELGNNRAQNVDGTGNYFLFTIV